MRPGCVGRGSTGALFCDFQSAQNSVALQASAEAVEIQDKKTSSKRAKKAAAWHVFEVPQVQV